MFKDSNFFKISVALFCVGIVAIVTSIILIKNNMLTVEHSVYYTLLQTQEEKNSAITSQTAKIIAIEKGTKKYQVSVDDYDIVKTFYRIDGTWAVEFSKSTSALDDEEITFIVDENKKDVVEFWNSSAAFHQADLETLENTGER